MPVFISYSHNDKKFVDKLAAQLVRNKINVWLDRWELSVGDSIIDRIQDAIEGSSALIVILSNSSVQSEWCKKELSTGLLRELEEKKVVVLPLLLEDCKIPLFLRGKLYADFRRNFDDGLRTVLEASAKVTSNTLGRADSPEYHLDWAIDWGTMEDRETVRIIMVEQAIGQPYTVLNEVCISADVVGGKHYKTLVQQGKRDFANYRLVSFLTQLVSKQLDLRVLLEDAMPKKYEGSLIDPVTGANYSVRIETRRLGTDTGRDVLFNLGDQIAVLKKSLYEVNLPDSKLWDEQILSD